MLNVDEQQDATKHLKQYRDIDDIEPPWKHVATNWMKKIVEKIFSGKVH